MHLLDLLPVDLKSPQVFVSCDTSQNLLTFDLVAVGEIERLELISL
jgi:hypothetical protein